MQNHSINELSTLAARNKLVPFLGAGTSYGHLNLDWDSISTEMAKEINCERTANPTIAENYVIARGNKGLCEFLKKKLLVNEYNEELDIVPLITASLGVGLIYSTNQDNVFEKCLEKYGRKYRVISRLEDLALHLPGESMYIKYHGDLEYPETVIFSESSYKDRMKNKDHFFNIRMRSDLLTKSFLFIGYSFRDPNIVLIFEEISKAFGGKIPMSYLIAFNHTNELEILCKSYGINVINPMSEIPDCVNNSEAFTRYMNELCEETYSKKTGEEIDSFFRPSVPSANRVVSKYEIAGVEKCAQKSKLKEVIELFRATFDTALIPEIYNEQVANIIIDLCKKCSSQEESDELSAATFHLNLKPEYAITVMAAIYTTALHREHPQGFDLFMTHIPNLNESHSPLILTLAIALIKEWNLSINDTFRYYVVNMWIEGYEKIPADLISLLKEQIDWAWIGKTKYSNPMRKINKTPVLFKSRTVEEISKDLLIRMPKSLQKPYDN